MALKVINRRDIRELDLVPHAVIARSYFEKSSVPAARAEFIEDEDDLDRYEGAAFSLDDKLLFALRHYRGHPVDTLTIYLSDSIRNVEKITAIIGRIVSEFHLPKEAVIWERSSNPDL